VRRGEAGHAVGPVSHERIEGDGTVSGPIFMPAG
jgi:hypothetical protein